MATRSEDEIIIVLPQSYNPARVSVFRRRRISEVSGDSCSQTPVDRVQLLAGVDFTIENKKGQ